MLEPRGFERGYVEYADHGSLHTARQGWLELEKLLMKTMYILTIAGGSRVNVIARVHGGDPGAGELQIESGRKMSQLGPITRYV